MKASKPGEFLNLEAPPEPIESLYQRWQAKPLPSHMSDLLESLKPTINSAVTTYASSSRSPLLTSRAQVLAARAVRSFDPARGTSLKSHVMLQLQPLRRYAAQAAQPLRMSERNLMQLRTLQQAEREFLDVNDREPTDIELADKLGVSVRKLAKIRSYSKPVTGPSFEAPGGEDAGIVDYTAETPDYVRTWMDYVYAEADPRDQQIMDWKLGRNGKPRLSNREIAARLRLTPAAISQRLRSLQARILAGEELAP